MHVGLNALFLVPGEVGGSEIYTRRLVHALQRPGYRFTVFCGREAAPSLRAEGFRVRVLPVHARNKPARIAAEMTLLPLAARRAGCDVLHSLGTTSPLVPGMPSVVTILDLIYDHFPATFPKAARRGLKALVGPAAKRQDHVITISAAVKQDVVARLGVPAERVTPVLLGMGQLAGTAPTPEGELRERLGLGTGTDVVLCVSAALVHKNLARLIGAFARLDRPDTRLVLVGRPGLEADALRAEAVRLGVSDRVVQTGWIETADIEGLYALATACVYPSLYEGFGLPVLEAMARDVPIACSNATSLPEVAGDAALLFDPLDEAAIAASIGHLLDDGALRAQLVARGRRRVPMFTWERCADGVIDVYEGVR